MVIAVFFLIAIVSVATGAGVVFSRNVVRSAIFLVLNLLTVAALYVLLSSELLALVQVLVYGGAVTILLIFALMLTRSGDIPRSLDGPQKPIAILAAIVGIVLVVLMVGRTAWPRVLPEPVAQGIESVGTQLFTTWLVPFEIASLVLLVALVGAVVIARTEDGE
jgi:NADH:ubiquinone oxidoreductase subunit 6 (subunit J)